MSSTAGNMCKLLQQRKGYLQGVSKYKNSIKGFLCTTFVLTAKGKLQLSVPENRILIIKLNVWDKAVRHN